METIAPDGAPKGAVLVIHSWWGLTTSFRTYASVLSEAGYLVGLTDLFDGKTAETEAQAKALRAARRRRGQPDHTVAVLRRPLRRRPGEPSLLRVDQLDGRRRRDLGLRQRHVRAHPRRVPPVDGHVPVPLAPVTRRSRGRAAAARPQPSARVSTGAWSSVSTSAPPT